jgi:hypothetical protein
LAATARPPPGAALVTVLRVIPLSLTRVIKRLIALRSRQKIRSPACEALVLGNLLLTRSEELGADSFKLVPLPVTINLVAGPLSAAYGAI